MTLDDGTSGLKRRLNLLALGAVVILIVLARTCSSRGTTAPVGEPARSLPEQGTSVSKDHGASTGAPKDK